MKADEHIFEHIQENSVIRVYIDDDGLLTTRYKGKSSWRVAYCPIEAWGAERTAILLAIKSMKDWIEKESDKPLCKALKGKGDKP